MKSVHQNNLIQFIKFGIIGISNTLITAIVIWILTTKFYFSNYSANIIGYIIGLTNSFVWNKKWTFSNSSDGNNIFIKFIVTFVISYFFQLVFLSILLLYTKIDSYICQLISIGIYTSINFLLNKYYTFKDNMPNE